MTAKKGKRLGSNHLQMSSLSFVNVTSHSIIPAPCKALALYDSIVCSGYCMHAPLWPMEKSDRAKFVVVRAHSSDRIEERWTKILLIMSIKQSRVKSYCICI